MSRIRVGVLAGALALAVVATPAQAASQKQDHLDMYRAKVGAAKAAALVKQDVDVSAQKQLRRGKVRLDLVLTRGQRRALAADGVRAKLVRVKGGKTVRQFAAAQAARGTRCGGTTTARRHRRLHAAARARQPAAGQAREDRPDLSGPRHPRDQADAGSAEHRTARVPRCSTARRSTRASGSPRRPTAACSTGTSANGEPTTRRSRAAPERPSCGSCSSATRTATSTRSTTSGCGARTCATTTTTVRSTVGDGVDPNRNYPEHFNYDQRGLVERSARAKPIAARPPARSPRRGRDMGLMTRIKFAFQVNYHSYGPYLLYPAGWQVGTPTADDPIYYACRATSTTRRSRARSRACPQTCSTSPTAR